MVDIGWRGLDSVNSVDGRHGQNLGQGSDGRHAATRSLGTSPTMASAVRRIKWGKDKKLKLFLVRIIYFPLEDAS